MSDSRPRKVSRSVVLCLGLVAVCAENARAELFFDFSLGAAYTQPARIKVEDETTFPSISASERTSFDLSGEFAFRFGGWIEPLDVLGFAGDFSYFQAVGGPAEENHLWPFTFLVMVRAPLLKSRNHPHGQIQPYLGVGPSLVFSDSIIDLRPEVPDRVNTSAVDLGIDARAGLAWELLPHLALFVEYRFLYFRQKLEETTDFAWFESIDASTKTDYLTHHLLLGLSVRF